MRRPRCFAAVALLALAACKPTSTAAYQPVALSAPVTPSAPDGGTTAPTPSVAGAPDAGSTVDAGPEPSEEQFLSIECEDRIKRRRTTLPVDACRFRGVVQSARPVVIAAQIDHFAPPLGRGPTRVIELSIEPDDTIPCNAPFDTPDPDIPGTRTKLEDARLLAVHGGARLAPRLAEGARLCGWTHRVRQPGLYPVGWEGALADASGALLGAWSWYFDRAEAPGLAAAFRFSREGSVRRIRIDEGGAFVVHDRVRIHHGGTSAVSGGDEVILRARDGTFGVAATSDLTEGQTPVFVGHHDGFWFSAIRLDGG